MNSKFGVTVAALFALTGLVPIASADETSDKLADLRQLDPEARRVAVEAMSDEERGALRKSMQGRRDVPRAERESMTPEERDAARQERKERFESMTPEQQGAMKERRAGRQQSGDRSSRQGRDSSQRSQGGRRNRNTGNE